MALWIGNIDRYVLVEEKHKEEGVAIDGCKVENVIARSVQNEGISASLQEKVDDIVMTSLRSPHRWCSMRLSSSCIDIGAGLDEELACRILIVDCRPLSQRKLAHEDSIARKKPAAMWYLRVTA